MQVDRGTFYNHIFRNKKDNTWYSERREILREEILKIYEENRQIFGASKITAILKQNGYRTSKRTVAFLMHDMGLQSVRHRAKAIYEKEVKSKIKSINNSKPLVRMKYGLATSHILKHSTIHTIFALFLIYIRGKLYLIESP